MERFRISLENSDTTAAWTRDEDLETEMTAVETRTRMESITRPSPITGRPAETESETMNPWVRGRHHQIVFTSCH